MTSFSSRIGYNDCACVVDVEADGSRLMGIGMRLFVKEERDGYVE